MLCEHPIFKVVEVEHWIRGVTEDEQYVRAYPTVQMSNEQTHESPSSPDCVSFTSLSLSQAPPSCKGRGGAEADPISEATDRVEGLLAEEVEVLRAMVDICDKNDAERGKTETGSRRSCA